MDNRLSTFFNCCGCMGNGSQQISLVQVSRTAKQKPQCGIGVIFSVDDQGALVVDSLVPGGPAWQASGKGGLQVNDVLKTVDGKNVQRWPIVQLAPLLLGPEGTVVRLGVERNEWISSTQNYSQKEVVLEVRRQDFKPPNEHFESGHRSPIVDARKTLELPIDPFPESLIEDEVPTVRARPSPSFTRP